MSPPTIQLTVEEVGHYTELLNRMRSTASPEDQEVIANAAAALNAALAEAHELEQQDQIEALIAEILARTGGAIALQDLAMLLAPEAAIPLLTQLRDRYASATQQWFGALEDLDVDEDDDELSDDDEDEIIYEDTEQIIRASAPSRGGFLANDQGTG